MVIASSFLLVDGSLIMDDVYGQGAALILFSAAAVDTSIGLVIILNLYSIKNIDYFGEPVLEKRE